MTEGEWQGATDWSAMIAGVRKAFLGEARARRQARRFAYACACELRWRVEDRRALEALRLLDRALESPTGRHGLGRARKLAGEAECQAFAGPAATEEWRAVNIIHEATLDDPWVAAVGAGLCLEQERGRSGRWQCETLRELFGSPFRPVALPAGWQRFQRGLIVRLAGQAHAEKRYDNLPILADALEDAGCTDAFLLGHCRTGTHLPGCWAVELLRDED